MNAIDIDIHSLNKGDFKNYKLVDIREDNELAQWPCLIACPHIPLSGFPENMDKFNKDENYLIFCAMGGRSHHLAEILAHQGYTAYSVNNGIGAVNAYLKDHGHA